MLMRKCVGTPAGSSMSGSALGTSGVCWRGGKDSGRGLVEVGLGCAHRELCGLGYPQHDLEGGVSAPGGPLNASARRDPGGQVQGGPPTASPDQGPSSWAEARPPSPAQPYLLLHDASLSKPCAISWHVPVNKFVMAHLPRILSPWSPAGPQPPQLLCGS